MSIRYGDASDRTYDSHIYPACEAYAAAKVETFRSQWDSYRSPENAKFPELSRANAFNVEAYGDGGIEGGVERKEAEIYQAAYTEKLTELTQQQEQAEAAWTKADFDQWSGVDYGLGADAQDMRSAHYVAASEQAFPGEMDPVVVQESMRLLHSDDADTTAKRERAVQQEATYEQEQGAKLAQDFKGASARYLEPAAWMKSAGAEEAHTQAKAAQVTDATGRVVGERVGERIDMKHGDQAAIRAGLDDMQARGKSGIRVTGSEEFRRQTAIEATARGMRVEGHKMTREDLQTARERRAELMQQQENVRTASTGEESLKARTAEEAERVNKTRSSQAAENKKQQQPQEQQQQPEAKQQQEDTLGIRSAEAISKESFQEGKQAQDRELAEKANAERGQAAGVHGGQATSAPTTQQQPMSERAQAQGAQQPQQPQAMSERAQANASQQQPSYAESKLSERAQASAAKREDAGRGDDSRVARMRAAQQRGQEQLQSREQSHKRTTEHGHR